MEKNLAKAILHTIEDVDDRKVVTIGSLKEILKLAMIEDDIRRDIEILNLKNE